ncbi:GNAT family N-acetyltransferase [Chryseolinea sp. T2]|uniref:GNAT family N-acetyltransferase n=1 Tax=Chryseolinea sp. T2 TaxID=3129255 RepID=UPI003076DF8D
MLLIEPYNDSHFAAFRDLNMEWLLLYNLAEEPDYRVLSDPRGQILEKDGFIWVALSNGIVVGTAALIKEEHGTYELAKMSVAPEFRGKGVGRMLITTCIEKARSIGAEKIELFSNHQLGPALKLYESVGFRYVPVSNSPFETADIKMELTLPA